MKTLTVNLNQNSYDIIIQKGAIHSLSDDLNLDRKVMIITDQGVPQEYKDIVLSQCKYGLIETVVQGEQAKSFTVYEYLLKSLLKNGFTRSDLVIALGGGVIGDLAGFVAASFMRGIDFINIPTTTLSQIDSSIGGKVAINLDGVKNIVGTFYQPKKVIIDSNTLKTLSKRHFNNGLVEAVKAGLIYDEKLFSLFEQEYFEDNLDEIIYRSLLVKKQVVEQDEKEENIRKILNFGHTIGHAVESIYGLSGLLHGEAVAVGIMPMLSNILQDRVKVVFDKLAINTDIELDIEKALEIISHDKKASGKDITIVTVDKIGQAEMKKVSLDALREYMNG